MHPDVDGRHGVPELPRWNETSPASGHDCRRLDTRFYEDARCQWQGNQHHWCCKSPNGEPRETRQITYITDNSDKLFLSREACIALGIITTRFPTVGEVMSPSCPQISCAGSTDETDIDTYRCGGSRRQKPPPVPTKLPFAAHGETDQNSRNI